MSILKVLIVIEASYLPEPSPFPSIFGLMQLEALYYARRSTIATKFL